MEVNPEHISFRTKFNRRLLQGITLLLYPFLYIIPRNKNIWIFGSNHGTKFSENSKYLFIYMNHFHPEIKSVWMTKSKEVIKELKEKNFNVCKMYGLKGFWYTFRAKYAISSHGLHDLNKITLSGAKNIQLWHGTALKNIMRNHKSLKEFTRRLTGSRKHHIIATSEEVKKKFQEIFYVKKGHVHITGYPRNDALFFPKWLEKNNKETIEYLNKIKKKTSFDKIIFYLPTWRSKNMDVDLIEDYGFDLDYLEKKLEKMNAILIIKAHPVNMDIGKDFLKNSKRVHNFPDKELPDIYPLLGKTDLLITDYSSVYFDFLLLDRQMVFAPFDIEKKKKKSFFYNYDKVTPGPKGKNWKEVIELAEKELNKDNYKKQRKKINKKFNKFNDSENSKRVSEMIFSLENGK